MPSSWLRQNNASSNANFLNALFETTGEGIWIIDNDVLTLDVNPAMCEILGRRPDQIIGRPIYDFVDAINAEIFEFEIAARQRGRSGGYEIDLSRPDGSRITCINNASPLFDDQGAKIASIGLWTDITEVKQAQHTLVRSEARYREIVYSVDDMIQEVDADGRLLFVNQSWIDKLGYNAVAARDLVVQDIFHPDSFAYCLSLIEKSLAGERSEQVEMVFISRNGAEIFAEGNVAPIHSPDQVFRIRCIFRDVSERKKQQLALQQSNEKLEIRVIERTAELAERSELLEKEIAERRQAEAAMSASEAKYRELIDGSNQGIFIHQGGVIVYANAEAAKLHGYEPGSLIGVAPYLLAAKHEKKRVVQYALQSEDGHLEIEAGKLDGDVFWVEGYGRNINWDGAPARQFTFVDVSEKKRVAQANQDLLRAIDNLSEAMALYDAEDRLVICNRQYRQLMQLGDDEPTVGINLEVILRRLLDRGLIPEAQPEPEVWLRERINKHRHIGEQSVALELERNGRWYLEREERLPDGGMMIIALDIDERKRQEELLASAVEGLDEGFVIFDADDRMVLCNSNYKKIYHPIADALVPGASLEEVSRRGARDLIGLRDEAEIEALVRDRMDKHRQFGAPFEQLFEDGRSIRVREALLPNGWTVGSRTDISDLKRVESELRQAQKMEAVGQLTGGVAHDFNNLLAVIMGNAELLSLDASGNDPKVAAIVRAASRGAELTRRLLAFSRKQTLLPQIIEIDALIGNMKSMLDRTLGETIEITTMAAPGLWPVVIDPGQLENALLNLAINARDAMPGGGRLVIEVENIHLDEAFAKTGAEISAGDYVVLAVTDNGAGMGAEVLEHVFEPFFTTKSVGAGSGLGLAMIYGFVKQSGGHVAIYSEPGNGTTVRLYLPRQTGTASEQGQSRQQRAPNGGGERILLVEDDHDVRELAATMLRDLGYRVEAAPDALEALSRLARKPAPDLLLTDLMLPNGINGLELSGRARRQVPAVRLLLMSGFAEQTARLNDFADSDIELMSKPFGKSELAQKVRHALDN